MDDLTVSVNSIVMSDDSYLNNTNIASNIHPRLDIYKKKAHFISNQAERRKEILKEQKKKRDALVEASRHIHEKKVSNVKKSPSKQSKKYAISVQYANQLMYSEWLEEVPEDLDSNWIMILCPVGKRCLVVASEGSTSVYNKAGKLISKHSSKLPGGCKESKIDETILDCIYNDTLMTYFIIDCLCWKSHPIVDSETEFRFYWLGCKLDESPEISQSSYENPYAFKNLPRVQNISKENIRRQFEYQYEYTIDGVLFYHKETHYTAGYTPLVGWLKPYMIPEILNVPMPDLVLSQAPSDYINAKNSIEKFEQEHKNRLFSNLTLNKINEIDMEWSAFGKETSHHIYTKQSGDFSMNFKENSNRQEL